MSKITFLGAGSSVFAKNVLGDCMLVPSIQGFEFALYDINEERLKDSENMLNNMKNTAKSTVNIKSYTDRKEALRGAKYVINAIQVGGYDPCTITDFEIPKKYGLRQTIADTLGIGGIFRNLENDSSDDGLCRRYARSVSRCLVLKLYKSNGSIDWYNDTTWWDKNSRALP